MTTGFLEIGVMADKVFKLCPQGSGGGLVGLPPTNPLRDTHCCQTLRIDEGRSDYPVSPQWIARGLPRLE
jgi:hypothetical protein